MLYASGPSKSFIFWNTMRSGAVNPAFSATFPYNILLGTRGGLRQWVMHTPTPSGFGATFMARGVGSGGGGGGWVGLGQGLIRTCGTTDIALPCASQLVQRVHGCPVSRPTGHDDRPRTPRWHTQEGDAAVPVCVGHACCLGKCVAWCSRPRWGGWGSLALRPPGELSAWTRHLQVYRHAAGRPLLPMVGGGHGPHTTRGSPHSLIALARVVLL